MIFGKKRQITIAYTVEKCDSCHIETRREFKDGDILFTKTASCGSCTGDLYVEKIYGQKVDT